MTNNPTLIKQALVAALTEHSSATSYWSRAFGSRPIDELPKVLIEEGFVKDDLFVLADNDRAFIEEAGFWNNFEKINKIIRAGGESFAAEDFSRPLRADSKDTLVESARLGKAVAKIFSLDIWSGHYEDMESVFYRFNLNERKELFNENGFISPSLKKEALQLENRVPAEERLHLMRMMTEDFHNHFKLKDDLNYTKLIQKLDEYDEKFSKDMLMLPNDTGITPLAEKHAWDNYDDILHQLEKNREKLTVRDFTRKIGLLPNILEFAFKLSNLHKVFAPAHWQDRLPEMAALWRHMKPEWKANFSDTVFEKAYAEAESLKYGGLVDYKNLHGKNDLLMPLNASDDEKKILPMGLLGFWDNIDVIIEELKRKDEPLTLADLRHTSGELNDTAILQAARFGHFAKILELARGTGEQLTVDDLTGKSGSGANVLGILAEKKELGLVFTPQLWVGRIDDLRALCQHLNDTQKKELEIEKLTITVKQHTLKALSNDNFMIKPRIYGQP